MKASWPAFRFTPIWALSWFIANLWLTPLLAQLLPAPELITSQQGLPQAFVPAIIQDSQGFIWMATRDGLCRYDGNVFKVFQPAADGSPSLSSSEIIHMALDHQGKIWLVSDTGDLDLFDPVRETFVNVSRQPFYQRQVGPYAIESVYIDSRNLLWLCIRARGLVCLDLHTKQIRRYTHQAGKVGSLSSDLVRFVIEDRSNKAVLWVATFAGLDRLDRRTGQFIHYQHQANNPASLPDDALKALYQLPNGNLLIRSNKYVSVLDTRTERVRQSYALSMQEEWWHWTPIVANRDNTIFVARFNNLYRFDEQKGLMLVAQLSDGQYIQCLFIDQSDVLWLGTNGGGVLKYNLRAGAFSAFPYKVSFHSDLLISQLGIPASQVPTLPPAWSYLFRSTTDSSGKLWFNLRTSPFFRFDVTTKELTPIPFPAQLTDESSNLPVPMATDPQGRVWAVNDSVAMWYDDRQKHWIQFPHRFRHRPTGISVDAPILEFVVDEQTLWMATKSRGLFRIDQKTGDVRRYAHNPKDPASLSNDNIFCLFADPANKAILWIGTFGSGLCRFDKRTGRSQRLTTANGLPNNVIYAAIPDRHGALWIATNQGLGRMDLRTFKTRIYTREDGLAGDEFNRHHYLRLTGLVRRSDGTASERIFLGGLEGITSFDPGNLREDTYQPRVQITNIQINNKPMPPGEAPMQTLSDLTLPYDKNFVTVQFAGMQYNRRNKLRYRYQLEGLEDTWTETDRPITVYTGLQPGHYVLRLNAANTSGIWSPHVRILNITIKPPLWATWWAYTFYILAIGGIIWGLFRASVNRLKLRQSVILKQKEIELKHQEAEQLRETNDMKTRFFANITHEFRTPLTLILAPTEQMASENPTPKNRRRLVTIEQNAHQLLRLINQLLDLSRLEASVMPIHESRGDLTECITQWLQPLTEQTKEQGLDLTFTSDVTGSHWFDPEKLERIVYNLTANALKFTKKGGISVSLTDSAEQVILTISDTGIGITPQHLPHIFDRFFRANLNPTKEIDTESSQSVSPQQAGTGIGLALVKELVLLQQGRISVDSAVNEGTTFIVELPYRRVISAETTPEDVASLQKEVAGVSADSWTSSDETNVPRILIVEDNDEIAHFIAESLPDQYRIRRAVNGQHGLEQALEHLPDLIISDVVMPVQAGTIQSEPEMDGFTLCGKLKADLRTSHIPVILLTAKSSVENRMEGLAQGADDYLTKPFQVQELQLRVRNQLASKRRLREWVRANLINPDTTTSQPAPEPPDPFLAQLYELMEANLGDTRFGVEPMMAELGMSRTNLFRKVKALTDLSANDLLRQYRLKRAAQLLRAGNAVTETAYQVGFDSPAYFTKCFREVYQLTPREFAAQA